MSQYRIWDPPNPCKARGGVIAMDVKTVSADVIFRVFTACPGDVSTLILDVRGYKEFSKKHVIGSYCIRLSANGKVLLVRPHTQCCLFQAGGLCIGGCSLESVSLMR